MERYEDMVLAAFQLSKASESLVIYGEYFGGWYGDVRDQPLKDIVQYAPSHEFHEFDV